MWLERKAGIEPIKRVPTKAELRWKQEEADRKQHEAQFFRERRMLLTTAIMGIPVATVGLTAAVLTSPRPTEPEQSLDQLVRSVTSLENHFREPNLDSPEYRTPHTLLMADIFQRFYQTALSKDAFYFATRFILRHDAFVKLFTARSQTVTPLSTATPRNPSAYFAFTDNGICYIDLSHLYFNSNHLKNTSNLPPFWNPLKSSRMGLTHEWGHFTTPNPNDLVLLALDPTNKYPSKRASGFSFQDLSHPDQTLFDGFDEAATELSSISLNRQLFGSLWYSNFIDSYGRNITQAAFNLDSLISAAGISIQELFKLHSQSEPHEFLFMLVERAGIVIKGDPLDPAVLKNVLEVETGFVKAIMGDKDNPDLRKYQQRLIAHRR